MNKPITPEKMHEWVEKTWQKCQDEARGDVKGQAMSTQPEALRLADELEMWTLGEPAAVELRRLHQENVELREAIKRAVQVVRIEQAQPVAHTLNCVCGATWDIKADGSEEMVHMPDSTPPQRRPLHDMAIFDLADEHLYEGGKNYGVLSFARAIEAAHGIKGEA